MGHVPSKLHSELLEGITYNMVYMVQIHNTISNNSTPQHDQMALNEFLKQEDHALLTMEKCEIS